MARISKNLPGFSGVAAGQTATTQLPLGPTYMQVHLIYTGATVAQMTAIRVVINGQQVQTYSAAELDAMNAYVGRAKVAGITTIDFTRKHLLTRAAEEFTALGTNQVRSALNPVTVNVASIEVDFDAATVAPTLYGVAVQDETAPVGFIRFIRKYTHTPTAIGDYEISDIPPRGVIDQMHFNAALVTNLKITRDGFEIFDRTKALNVAIQQNGYSRTPVAASYIYDPTEDGFGGEGLSTQYQTGAPVNDLRFTATMSAAGSLPVIVSSIAQLGA